jgi:uncharacterized protein (TIGR02145 family)
MINHFRLIFSMTLAFGLALMFVACGGTKGNALDKETREYLSAIVEKANAKIAKMNSDKDGEVKTAIALSLEKDKLVFKMVIPKKEFTDEELLQVEITGESFKSMQSLMFGMWFLAIDAKEEIFNEAFFARLSENNVPLAFVVESQDGKKLMEVPIDLSKPGHAEKKVAEEGAGAKTVDENANMTLKQWVDKFNSLAPLKPVTPRPQVDMSLSGKIEQMSLRQIKLDSSRIVFDFLLADPLGQAGAMFLTSIGPDILDMVIHFTSKNFGKENNLFPVGFLKAMNGSNAEIVFQFTGKDKITVETVIPKEDLPIPYEEKPNEKATMIDGYPAVKIGNQIWMAENLNIETPGSRCYDDDPEQCKIGGRLYTIDEARTVCPEGWHLPDTSEFNTLMNEVGDEKRLVSANYSEWTKRYAGTDDYGFRMRPTGQANGDIFNDGNFGSSLRHIKATHCGNCVHGYLWASTVPKKKKDYRGRHLGFYVWFPKYYLYTHTISEGEAEKRLSVRCIKGEPIVKEKVFETFTDPRDNRKYRMVEINGQKWMAENLNFKSPRSICYDADDAMCEKFGRLYNLSEAQTVCPAGWHLPDTNEFKKLLKDAGETGALLYNDYEDWGRTDVETDVGFGMRPSGVLESREFKGITRNRENRDEIDGGWKAALWTSTPSAKKVNRFGMRGLGYYISFPSFKVEHFSPTSEDASITAYSVRCAMGEPAPAEDPNKVDSIVDVRDNRTYRTVKIGNQVWMAENLKYKADSSLCHNHDEQMCEKYGRLYSGESTLTACPAGWHLPSEDEWIQLTRFAEEATYLRAKTDWKKTGTDEYNFSVLPSGAYTYPYWPKWGNPKEPEPERFNKIDYEAEFWTSTTTKWSQTDDDRKIFSTILFQLTVSSDDVRPTSRTRRLQTSALPIRCVKDE